jgi:hypothetical protein
MRESEEMNTTSTSGKLAVFRNGVPDSGNTYNTPNDSIDYDTNQAVYIQDKWRPIRKLTLNLGLRFETNYGWQPATCQPQAAFVQAQCFAAIQGAPDWKALAPRFSAVYDLFGDGKTALKVAANRYHIPPGVANAQRLNPDLVTSDTHAWSDLNRDGVPQLNELGPSTGFNFGTTNRYSPNLTWPVANEYSIEVEHQLPWNVVVAATFTRRERGKLGSQNMAVPLASYIPLQVTEVNSGRQVTVYNQSPALIGKFDVLWDNLEALNTTYNGADLVVNKRLRDGWMLMAGASFGRTLGDIYGGTFDLNNPNLTFRQGLVGNDVPVWLRGSGLYQLRWGWAVSGTVQHYTEFPENTTVLVSGNTTKLTQVSQSLVIEPRGTTRPPPVNSLDVSLRKTWRLRTVALEPVLDAYNVTNTASLLSRVTQLGPTYFTPVTIQRGRVIRLGANVSF